MSQNLMCCMSVCILIILCERRMLPDVPFQADTLMRSHYWHVYHDVYHDSLCMGSMLGQSCYTLQSGMGQSMFIKFTKPELVLPVQ